MSGRIKLHGKKPKATVYVEEINALIESAIVLRHASTFHPIPQNSLSGDAWNRAAEILERAADWLEDTDRRGYWENVRK